MIYYFLSIIIIIILLFYPSHRFVYKLTREYTFFVCKFSYSFEKLEFSIKIISFMTHKMCVVLLIAQSLVNMMAPHSIKRTPLELPMPPTHSLGPGRAAVAICSSSVRRL